MRLVSIVLLILFCLSMPLRAEVHVVTSIAPLALLVKDLGKDDVNVTSLVPNAGSIHHYSMRVSDRLTVEKADLVVLVGAGLEPFLDKLAAVDSNKLLRLDELDDVASIAGVATDEHDHHGNHGVDPHLWLSPHNAVILAKAIASELIRLLPDESAQIKARTEHFLAAQQHTLLTTPINSNRQYFAYHNAMGYLLQSSDIELQGVLTNSNESRLGMRSLYAIKQAVKQADNVCVLVQGNTREMTQKILGTVPFAELDILADQRDYASYNDYLAAMLKAINECN